MVWLQDKRSCWTEPEAHLSSLGSSLREKKTTVWPKMELKESLGKTSVRPFNISACTLQTENTAKHGRQWIRSGHHQKTWARWRDYFTFLYGVQCWSFSWHPPPIFCGSMSKYPRVVMQHYVAVTQSFLWMDVVVMALMLLNINMEFAKCSRPSKLFTILTG